MVSITEYFRNIYFDILIVYVKIYIEKELNFLKIVFIVFIQILGLRVIRHCYQYFKWTNNLIFFSLSICFTHIAIHAASHQLHSHTHGQSTDRLARQAVNFIVSPSETLPLASWTNCHFRLRQRTLLVNVVSFSFKALCLPLSFWCQLQTVIVNMPWRSEIETVTRGLFNVEIQWGKKIFISNENNKSKTILFCLYSFWTCNTLFQWVIK